MWRGLKWVKIYRDHKEPRHSGIKVRDERDRGKGGLTPLTGIWNSVNSYLLNEIHPGYGNGNLKSGHRRHSLGLVNFRRCLNVFNH